MFSAHTGCLGRTTSAGLAAQGHLAEVPAALMKGIDCDAICAELEDAPAACSGAASKRPLAAGLHKSAMIYIIVWIRAD